MAFLKRTATLLTTAAAMVGTSLTVAAPASAAAPWKCATSSRSIDNPSTWIGSDDWNFKMTVCAAHGGSTAYAKVTITWDGPVLTSGADDRTIFDDAEVRYTVYKSVPGTDPAVKSQTVGQKFEDKLEDSDRWGNYNNSFASDTFAASVGSTKAYAGGIIRLDFDGDGRSYQTLRFTLTPLA
ncbi:hypothetical protein [Streptomyces sp. NPDC056549]|uniref:hypothetical protein n=1 Tax=Streptomyces sp. NPDC056549 TaxID=3345864 RepID=UPI0036C257A1